MNLIFKDGRIERVHYIEWTGSYLRIINEIGVSFLYEIGEIYAITK